MLPFSPRLIIFDKDGTLIDFKAMWSDWIFELTRRLEEVVTIPLRAALFRAMEVDPVTRTINPIGTLALEPMAKLHEVTQQVLRDCGLSSAEVARAMRHAWHAPDPVALAHPLTDLVALFKHLRAQGAQIAIATSDDRAATEATLDALHLRSFTSALVCADDGLPIKPAPDMILHLCAQLDSAPSETVMVGDSVSDVRMGRAAGVRLTVGVLSGVTPREKLAPYADLVLNSIAELW